jgi:hypothetical protein
MKNEIASITEAFSMQPVTYRVTTWEDYNKGKLGNWSHVPEMCKEIKLETVDIGEECGNPVQVSCYVGYNFNGIKIFQIIAKSANVTFNPKQS